MFLLIFVVVYGFLQASNLFRGAEGSKGIYAIIALAAAFLITLSKDAFTVITKMTPWFTALLIFIFLIFLVLKMFVGSDESLFKDLIKRPEIYWVLIILFMLIIIISFASTFGQRSLEGTLPESENAVAEDEQFEMYTPEGNYIEVKPDQQALQGRTDVVDPQAQPGSTATTDYETNLTNTLVNPKVLGMIALLLISFFAIIFMAKSSNPQFFGK